MDLGFDATIVRLAVSKIRRKGFVPSEDSLLAVIAAPRNPMELYWAVIALGHFGTQKSIPLLKPLVDYPKQDVKITVVHQIAKIAGKSETEFYGGLLTSATYKEKGTAMHAIADVADERAIDPVIAFFAKNRARINRRQLVNYTCTFGAIYLWRMSAKHSVAKQFLDENLGLLLDNTDERELRGWEPIHGRPKNEWVSELFELAGRPLPGFVTARFHA